MRGTIVKDLFLGVGRGPDMVGEILDTLEGVQNQFPPVPCGLGEAAQPLCPRVLGREVGQ